MPLASIEIQDFRCIEHGQLELDPRCNVISGANASGKTSLLEACFLLGSGHSFRTRQTAPLVRYSANSFLVTGKVDLSRGLEALGVQGFADSKIFKVAGSIVRGAAELAMRLPVQAIEPEVHRLIEDGPNRRRQFLDWGVFHVEPQFHAAWQRYSRALRQRNAALRSKEQRSAEIELWDAELIEHGSRIAAMRESYTTALEPLVAQLGRELLDKEVRVEHAKGWHRDLEFGNALAMARARDLKFRTTTVGPHRADLRVEVEGHHAREQVSRGQQKLLACVLLLAQQIQRASLGLPATCLLLDDPAAELDVDNLWKLLGVVQTIPVQLVITTLSQQHLPQLPPHRLFHVEHGRVRQVA